MMKRKKSVGQTSVFHFCWLLWITLQVNKFRMFTMTSSKMEKSAPGYCKKKSIKNFTPFQSPFSLLNHKSLRKKTLDNKNVGNLNFVIKSCWTNLPFCFSALLFLFSLRPDAWFVSHDVGCVVSWVTSCTHPHPLPGWPGWTQVKRSVGRSVGVGVCGFGWPQKTTCVKILEALHIYKTTIRK